MTPAEGVGENVTQSENFAFIVAEGETFPPPKRSKKSCDACGANQQRNGHHNVHDFRVPHKNFPQKASCKKPNQIANRTCKRQKNSRKKNRPETLIVRQDKRSERADAKQNHFCVGQIHEKPRKKARDFLRLVFQRIILPEHFYCEKNQICRADVRQKFHIAIQNSSQKKRHENCRHRVDKKSREKTEPLFERVSPPKLHRRRERTQIGRTGSNSCDIAIK